MRVPLYFLIFALGSSSSSLAQSLTVEDGAIVAVEGVLFCEGSMSLVPGAEMTIKAGAEVSALTLNISSGAILRNCGTLNVDQITNSGEILADCGGDFNVSISGTIVNEGRLRVSLGTDFMIGEITNSGIVDFITAGTGAAPTTNVGGGHYYDAECPGALSVVTTGGALSGLKMEALEGHRYGVEFSTTQNLANWLELVSLSQPGIDGDLFFALPSPVLVGPKGFFRVVITD